MGKDRLDVFSEERTRLNEIVMKYAGRDMKRLLNLDWRVYEDGALPKKTKELLGLVASMVLRCDDCVFHHLNECIETGVNDAEIEEALAIALVVGGSITVPHLRRALDAWDEAKKRGK